MDAPGHAQDQHFICTLAYLSRIAHTFARLRQKVFYWFTAREWRRNIQLKSSGFHHDARQQAWTSLADPGKCSCLS